MIYFFYLYYGIFMEYHFERAKSILQVSILFFWSLSLFFFSNRTKYRKNIWNIHVSYCFIVFYIFYLVIKNIFKRELKREKTGKNLKIDSANFYQNQIFQDTDILFLFSIFQHIHHTVSFIHIRIQMIETIKTFS